MADLSKIKLPDNQVLIIKDKNAGYSIEVVGDELHLKNAAGTVISTVEVPTGSFYSKIEFNEAPIYLNIYNSLLSERPTIVDIMSDSNTIKGRMYIYNENKYLGTNEFTAEIASNVSISAGATGLIPIIYYNMTAADVNRNLLATKVLNDIRRVGGGLNALDFRSSISTDPLPKFRAGTWLGYSLRTVSLSDGAHGNYGDSGLGGNSIDLFVSNQSSNTFTKNTGDSVSLYQNIGLDAKSLIEYYNTDDVPFINSISKTGGNYSIAGGHIKSARLTTYLEDGTINEQKTFNNINNSLSVTSRATDTGETNAIKIEISNQDTFSELQYGYFEVYDQHNTNMTLDLS